MEKRILKIMATLLTLTAAEAFAAGPGTLGAGLAGYEGIVEAERQAVISAQVTGAIEEVAVKAGDRVKKGQVLIRIDARAAMHAAAAGQAQLLSAQASLDLAKKELERQKQLFAQGYISQAAEDRAEAKFKVAEAQAHAQGAMASQAETEAGFYTVRAPFAGVVSELAAVQGDMALPGHALLTLYDPAALRVTTHIPHSLAAKDFSAATLEISGNSIKPARVKVLPAVDAATDTVEVRFDLPPSSNVLPGAFARVNTGTEAGAARMVRIPLTAVVKRGELVGAYVQNGKNQPMLRQIRLGRTFGNEVEVLSGIAPGERVVPDAETALNQPAH